MRLDVAWLAPEAGKLHHSDLPLDRKPQLRAPFRPKRPRNSKEARAGLGAPPHRQRGDRRKHRAGSTCLDCCHHWRNAGLVPLVNPQRDNLVTAVNVGCKPVGANCVSLNIA